MPPTHDADTCRRVAHQLLTEALGEADAYTRRARRIAENRLEAAADLAVAAGYGHGNPTRITRLTRELVHDDRSYTANRRAWFDRNTELLAERI